MNPRNLYCPIRKKKQTVPARFKRSTSKVIEVFPRLDDRRRGWLVRGATRYPCALGSGGPSRRKREGDGATPVAAMRVLGGYYRADRAIRPPARLGLKPIGPRDGWCDDVGDGRYNRPVILPVSARHECLRRSDHLYDLVLVLDWNIRPRIRGRGSAIFFHLARPDHGPTEGCIAVSATVMRRLLPVLGRGTVVRVRAP